jgi:hypothetical protein
MEFIHRALYGEHLSAPYSARSTVQAALPRKARVEIESIAIKRAWRTALQSHRSVDRPAQAAACSSWRLCKNEQL